VISGRWSVVGCSFALKEAIAQWSEFDQEFQPFGIGFFNLIRLKIRYCAPKARREGSQTCNVWSEANYFRALKERQVLPRLQRGIV